MRIDLNPGAIQSGSEIERPPSPGAAPQHASQVSQTEASGSGTNLSKLEQTALNSPEVRSERVQALHAQIVSGNYKASAEQVAGSMLEHMRVRKP